MIDNRPAVPESCIMPTPVVLFTEAEGQKVVAMCPVDLDLGQDNIISVGAMTNLALIGAKQCAFIVTHYVSNKRTKKQRVKASWQVHVPIAGTDERHVFCASFPDEGPAIIVPEKGPVVAHA